MFQFSFASLDLWNIYSQLVVLRTSPLSIGGHNFLDQPPPDFELGWPKWPGSFQDVLSDISEPLSPRDQDDAGLLDGSEDKDAILLSVMPQANAPAALPHSVLFEVCKRVAVSSLLVQNTWSIAGETWS